MKGTNLAAAAKKAGLVFLTVITFAAFTNVNGSQNNNGKMTEVGKQNYIAGIQSKVTGVKNDCIYFAAIYDVKEAVDALKEQLEKEENPSTRVLISLALCKLEESVGQGNDGVDQLYEWERRVQTLSDSIVNENIFQKKIVANNGTN